MRRLATALTLAAMVGLAAPAAVAQDLGPAPQAQSDKAPRLVIDRMGNDFGVLFEDAGKQRTVFHFTNEGDAPLEIKNVATTCGCTTPDLEKLIYQPGESGELVVNFDPHNRKGPQNRKVTIHSNDPQTPRMVLTIQADVKRMIEIEPAIVRLGQVPKGESRTMMVDVTGRAPGFDVVETEVLRVKGLGVEVLDKQVIEEDDGAKAARVTLLLNLGDGQEIGAFQGALAIKTTNSAGETDTKNVSIIGEILGDLNASPTQFNVGAMNAGTRMERHFGLTSREGRPFKILKVEERPLMGIDSQPRPEALQNISFEAIPESEEHPDRYMVRFGFEPRPDVVRQFFTQLVFHTDRKDQPEIIVRVLGRINTPVLTNRGGDEVGGEGD